MKHIEPSVRSTKKEVGFDNTLTMGPAIVGVFKRQVRKIE